MRLKDISAKDWPEIGRYVDTVVIPVANLCFDERGTLGLFVKTAEAAAEQLEKKFGGRLVCAPPLLWENRGSEEEVRDFLVSYAAGLRGRLGCTGPVVYVIAWAGNVPDLRKAWEERGIPCGVLVLPGEDVLTQAAYEEAWERAVTVWTERLAGEIVHMWQRIQTS